MSPSKAARDRNRRTSGGAGKKPASNKSGGNKKAKVVGVNYKKDEIEHYKNRLKKGVRTATFYLPVKDRDGQVVKLKNGKAKTRECQRFVGKEDIEYDDESGRLFRGVCADEGLIGHGQKRWLLAEDDPDDLEELQKTLLQELACLPRATVYKGCFKHNLSSTRGKKNVEKFLKGIMVALFECSPFDFLKKKEFNMEQFRNVAHAYHTVYGCGPSKECCDLKEWLLSSKNIDLPNPLAAMQLRRHQFLLDTIYDHMDVFCDETNDRMEQMDDRMEQMDNNAADIKKEIQHMEDTFQAHEKLVESLAVHVENLGGQLDRLDDLVIELKLDVKDLQRDVGELQRDVGGLQTKVSSLEQLVQLLAQRLAKLELGNNNNRSKTPNESTGKGRDDAIDVDDDLSTEDEQDLHKEVDAVSVDKEDVGEGGQSISKGFGAAVLSDTTWDEMEEMFPWMTDGDKFHNALVEDKGNPEDKIAPFSKPQITRKSLDTLLVEGRWLDDQMMNSFLKLVGKLPAAKKSYFFPTYFMDLLLRLGHADKAKCNRYDYEAVKEWKKVDALYQENGEGDIFAYDHLFFPINITSSHWILGVVFMQESRVEIFNSLRGKHKKHARHLMKYLEDEHLRKKGRPLRRTFTITNPTGVPQQENGCDCGVFVCLFAYFLALMQPLTFNQADVSKDPAAARLLMFSALLQDNIP